MERETEMVRDYSCCSYSNGTFLYACTYRLSSGFDIFFDIFSIESFGDSILFERSMLLALFISMGIHIYKNMENHPE